ncbi:hypothetical protein RHMOL_Rhmol05G0068300 [Rhododendron molle]|uniref:Uncharacterized protein n=1 Tax=Rhododendron molle TaxID=49168 RepID=A0ACC0NLA9_RHOML|nr:hypothetical protein RHMOL_Rhmol05G0068300 [Rhododendron molle]
MTQTRFNIQRKVSNSPGFTPTSSTRKLPSGKAMDLPKFVAINSLSNQNYLRPGGTNSYMKFKAMDVEGWGVKHKVQKAKSGDGLVHIRWCHTDKILDLGSDKRLS